MTKPNAKLIFLTGMPAAGKTYWGIRIAKKYKMQFTDLDELVAHKESASIQALFAKYGEAGFREQEHKWLQQLIETATTNMVVACGGGTPCLNENMALMKKAGTVIYLQAEIPQLLKHLEHSDEVRPLLNNRGNLSAYLADLLKKRKVFYEKADHILPAQDISLITFDKIFSNV
jgi:shikimate kinase